MLREKRWYKDQAFYTSFLLCFGLAFISFVYFILKGKGVFTLRDDFTVQQIPFAIRANEAIKNCEIGWLWNVDLGTNLIGAFSFYNLGSPFLWATLPFPADFFPYLVGWLYMLKYAFAGAFAYLYLRRFLGRKENAVFGAVLYAFCGFQTSNLLFYHFHDVVAFFPLLLLGVESLVIDKKRGYFAASIFLNCILNYFFFVGEVIFLVLYFFCRFSQREKGRMKLIISCCLEGLLGVGMGCFIFLPSAIFIIDNPRMNLDMYGTNVLTYSAVEYLEMIKAVLMPNEAMHNQSAVMTKDYSSTAAYLPGIGVAFVISYCIKERDWVQKIIGVSLAASLCPLLTRSFYLFSVSYRRWWYMPILFMALASAKVMENRENYNIKKGAVASLIIILLFTLYMKILPWSEGIESGIFHIGKFVCLIVAAVVPLCLISFVRNKKFFQSIVWGIVIVMAVGSTMTVIVDYRADTFSADEWRRKYALARELSSLDVNYRYNTRDNLLACIGGIKPIASFNSTVSGSIFELNDNYGFRRSNASGNFDEIPGLTQWLGAKYFLVNEADESSTSVVDMAEYEGQKLYVIERAACPIGFLYTQYILKSEFDNIDLQLKGIASIMALVVPDEKEMQVKGYLEKMDVSQISTDLLGKIDEYIQVTEENKINMYDVVASGFHAEINSEGKGYAFFSIPYEKGWTAYVDDTRTEILKVNGLMAIPIDSDGAKIRFDYAIPGVKTGIIISIASWLVLSAIYVFQKAKRYN